MNILIANELVLYLQLCFIFTQIKSNNYDQYDQESQSQENNSDMETKQEDNNYYQNSNAIENGAFLNDECNKCACNKCDSPPECCKKVCESCPNLRYRPRIQILQMSQMPSMSNVPLPMSIPSGAISSPMQMPISQIPQMPMQQILPPMSLNLPQMSMQISPMQTSPYTYPGSNVNQGLVMFPLSTNFVSLLSNLAMAQQQQKTIQQRLITVVNPSTTPQIATIQTNPTIMTTQSPITNTTKVQIDRHRVLLNLTKAQIYDNNTLELVIRNALTNYNVMTKPPEYLNNQVVPLMRRTKPTWMSKFGVVPIPDSIAENLMAQLRSIKGVGRRTKSTIILHS